MSTIAPYGSWASPISAASLVASGHPVSGGCFVGDDIWWLEARPTEQGRLAVRRFDADGSMVDVLPGPWNVRTRVHEYGGGAWTARDDGTLVFAEFSDQRLYRQGPGGEPVPLTPADEGMRFADLRFAGDEVLAVRETHGPEELRRDLVAVALDGSGIRSLVSGSRFLAYPRLSPDGSQLAWIAWDHPNMPWDGTELRVGELVDGAVGSWRTVLGGATESVLQPEWVDDESLYVITDRTGWWNLHRVSLGLRAEPDAASATTPDATPVRLDQPFVSKPREHSPQSDTNVGSTGSGAPAVALTAIAPAERDTGGPLWTLGTAWYLPLDDGRVLFTSTFGTDTLHLLDPSTDALTDIPLPLTSITPVAARGDRVLLRGGAATVPEGLRELDLGTGGLRDVRLAVDELPPAEYLPEAEAMTFRGEREVHAFVYRPRNPDFVAPPGELPPFVAVVHGGPTAHSVPTLKLGYAYLTSRGIGVIDINYGGSTGYGREYRERLAGQWGIVDVEDTIAAVQGLADAGLADRARLAIRGGSAGGWTVLSALVSSEMFACGVSLYGVADLRALADDTHDFESRYLDGLVGPLPEAAEVYAERAPINRVDRLRTPVLLLQGLDDPVVPPAQSERFRDALVAAGTPHAYVGYEGESHGFRRAETIIHATQAELSFYGQVMGFETPGVAPLPLWRPEAPESGEAG